MVVGVGLLMTFGGVILLLVAAFRQSVIWGLVTLLVPAGNIVFACKHWAEAKTGFLMNIFGAALMVGGIYSVPQIQAQLAALKNGPTVHAPTVAELDTQIAEQRQHLETLQATFAQDGAELMKQYQTLDAQRRALNPKDTAAIAKFNETAAGYQARNGQHKQMQQEIDATQKQIDTIADNRARTAEADRHKVVMYTTSHCPACKAAKQYLAQKGVSYREIDVEQSPEGAQAFQKLGGRGVPLILVGDKKMEGFSPQALDALL